MKVKNVPINDIRPYEKNPRINDPAVEPVIASIKEFGFKVPLVIDTEGVIVAGHTRYKAALKLGMETLPCIVADDLTPEKIKEYRLADNKVAEYSGWDFELLEAELIEIQELDADFDMRVFGFELETVETPQEIAEDDFEAELPEEPIAKPGDIWTLGKHRLMCGDSTVPEDMKALLGGTKAEMVFTDPPWNIAYATSYPHREYRPIKNDDMTSEEFLQFIGLALKQMYANLAPGAMVYVVMSQKEWGALMKTMQDNGFHWSSTIIWNKDLFVLARKDYHTKYEAIWYGWKDDAPRRCPLEDRGQCDVWDIDRPRVSAEHPTMKPLELVGRAVANSSKEGDAVLDQFGGAGATLIVCQQLNRRAFLMEIDPRYVDVTVKRYIEFMDGDASEVICERNGQSLPYAEMAGEAADRG